MYLLGICWIELPAHQDRKSGECFAPQSMVAPGFFYWSFGLILLLHLVAQNPLGVSIMRRTFTEWGDWSPDQPPSRRGQGAVLCETSYPPWPIWHGWTYQGPKSLLWCNCNSLVSLRHSRSTTSRWHAWLRLLITDSMTVTEKSACCLTVLVLHIIAKLNRLNSTYLKFDWVTKSSVWS